MLSTTNSLRLLILLLAAHISAHLTPIRLLYRWELEPDNHGIAAFNNDNEPIGYACASKLGTGNFQDHPISISIDRNSPASSGIITVGSKTHTLTSHPASRDDPSCSMIYNEHVVEVDCLVVRDGFMAEAITAPAKTSCFSKAYEAWDLMAGHAIHDPSRAVPLQGPQIHGQQLRVRAADSEWLHVSSVMLVCNVVGLPMIVLGWLELLRV